MAHQNGFFGLPLELRKDIYARLYTRQKDCFINKPRSGETDIRNLCAAIPQVGDELIEVESVQYRRAHFQVTHEPWRAPEKFRLRNLERISITIRHYACKKSLFKLRNDETMFRLRTMRSNLQSLVQLLDNRDFAKRPNLNVKFIDEPWKDTWSDPFWSIEMNTKKAVNGDILRTLDDSKKTRTIFEYLLEPLTELGAVCQRADIHGLRSIFDYEVDWKLNLQEEHDHDYMKTFTDMLKAWLESKVSREDMTFNQRWKKLLCAQRNEYPPTYIRTTRRLLLGRGPKSKSS